MKHIFALILSFALLSSMAFASPEFVADTPDFDYSNGQDSSVETIDTTLPADTPVDTPLDASSGFLPVGASSDFVPVGASSLDPSISPPGYDFGASFNTLNTLLLLLFVELGVIITWLFCKR